MNEIHSSSLQLMPQSLPSLTAQILSISVILLHRQIRHNSISTRRSIENEYDFLVVGAGTAGSIVASRLTENPNINVLLLEAGRPQTVVSDTPSWARELVHTDVDWNYTTISQLPNSGRAFDGHVALPRGRIIGGSHNLNYLVYSRGNRKDYDRWHVEFNLTGWSYADVLPYFLRSENNTDVNLRRMYPNYHSNSGPVQVITPPNPDPIITIFKDELIKHFGVEEVDQNGPSQLGTNYFQQTIYENATRATTASAYLESMIGVRSNLQVATEAFVTRILFDQTDPNNLRAIGLEFEYENQIRRVYARRDIILAAGSINTPQLLMLSGIGPQEHLQQFNIQTVRNLPVGFNLKDHILVPLDLEIMNQSLITSGIDWTMENMYRNFINFNGPLSQFPIVYWYFNSNLNNDTSYPDLQIDFTLAPLVNDLEQIVSRYSTRYRDEWREYYRPFVGHRNRLNILCFHYRPRSVGRVYLRSSDPHDYPLIDTRYLTDPYDIEAMIQVISTGLRLATSPPFNKYIRLYPQPIPGCQLCSNSNEPIWKCRSYLECYARTLTTTVGHQVGTCAMGSDRQQSVVDERLRVHGVRNLRVIDGSIFPHITNGNTNAPIMMFAEYGSQMIRDDYGI